MTISRDQLPASTTQFGPCDGSGRFELFVRGRGTQAPVMRAGATAVVHTNFIVGKMYVWLSFRVGPYIIAVDKIKLIAKHFLVTEWAKLPLPKEEETKEEQVDFFRLSRTLHQLMSENTRLTIMDKVNGQYVPFDQQKEFSTAEVCVDQCKTCEPR
jgi:hypothetical protein